MGEDFIKQNEDEIKDPSVIKMVSINLTSKWCGDL